MLVISFLIDIRQKKENERERERERERCEDFARTIRKEAAMTIVSLRTDI